MWTHACCTPAQTQTWMDPAVRCAAPHRSAHLAFLASRPRTQHLYPNGERRRGDLYVSCSQSRSSRRGRVGCRDTMMSVVLPPSLSRTCLSPPPQQPARRASELLSACSLPSVSLSPPSALTPTAIRSSHHISYPAPIPICIPPLHASHLPHRASIHPTSQAAVDVGLVLLWLPSHFLSSPGGDSHRR